MFSQIALTSQVNPSYRKSMVDLKLQVPVTEEVEVDAEILAAIDRGIEDADAGRTVPVDEVRKLIPQWIFQVRITASALTEFEEILAYSWAKFPATAEVFGNASLNHIRPVRKPVATAIVLDK